MALLCVSRQSCAYGFSTGIPRSQSFVRHLQEAQSLSKATGAAGPYIFDVEISGFFGVSLEAQDGELTLGTFAYQQYLRTEVE